jgi:hypothetical protein
MLKYSAQIHSLAKLVPLAFSLLLDLPGPPLISLYLPDKLFFLVLIRET